jgi:cytochrome c
MLLPSTGGTEAWEAPGGGRNATFCFGIVANTQKFYDMAPHILPFLPAAGVTQPEERRPEMRNTMKSVFLAGLIAAVAALPARAQDVAAGAAVFKTQCGFCHATVKGKTMLGPSLFGIVGQKAAADPEFYYSVALKKSGLIWNEATLDRWIADPAAVVPGNRMTYAGLKNAKQRADLIAYLATLK